MRAFHWLQVEHPIRSRTQPWQTPSASACLSATDAADSLCLSAAQGQHYCLSTLDTEAESLISGWLWLNLKPWNAVWDLLWVSAGWSGWFFTLKIRRLWKLWLVGLNRTVGSNMWLFGLFAFGACRIRLDAHEWTKWILMSTINMYNHTLFCLELEVHNRDKYLQKHIFFCSICI